MKLNITRGQSNMAKFAWQATPPDVDELASQRTAAWAGPLPLSAQPPPLLIYLCRCVLYKRGYPAIFKMGSLRPQLPPQLPAPLA